MAVKSIELAEAIAHLRAQLQAAIKEGEGQELRFKIQEIDVELKCTVMRQAEAGAGVKFMVVNAKAGGKMSSEAVQTIKLRLTAASKGGGQTLLNDVDDVK